MTSWPGAKVATAVAVWTPLVMLPVVSPSPTWWHRTEENRINVNLWIPLLVIIGLLDGWRITSRGLAEIRLPFFSSSDRSGEGGGVAFWAISLFCGESSTSDARATSLGGAGAEVSVVGRNTPTPCACSINKTDVDYNNDAKKGAVKSTSLSLSMRWWGGGVVWEGWMKHFDAFSTVIPLSAWWWWWFLPTRWLPSPWAAAWELRSQPEGLRWGSWRPGESAQLHWGDAWVCFSLPVELSWWRQKYIKLSNVFVVVQNVAAAQYKIDIMWHTHKKTRLVRFCVKCITELRLTFFR